MGWKTPRIRNDPTAFYRGGWGVMMEEQGRRSWRIDEDKVLILQHHGDHKEMPSDDNRMDTAFGSLNVIANLFQTGA